MMTAVILAAGLSRRFGRDKLLMDLDGKQIILYVLDLVLGIGFNETVLVYSNDELLKVVGSRNVKCVKNNAAAEGMSTSVRCGIRAAGPSDAYAFFTGDQPYIEAGTVKSLIAAFYKGEGSIVVPRYAGRNGNPVIFAAEWKEQLENLTGDTGGRTIIKNNPGEVCFIDMAGVKAGMDIDTWEDYVRCKGEDDR